MRAYIYTGGVIDPTHVTDHPKGDDLVIAADSGWNNAVWNCLKTMTDFFGVDDDGEGNEELCSGDGKENDPVNHPAHYCDGGIETLDFILAKRLDFLLGQVVKYVSRAGKKDPAKELEDLQKAQFYLNRKIDQIGARE